MNDFIKVELPEKKIIKVKVRDMVYIYHVLRTFRNEKGQPTNERILIGKLDKDTGMLIPNANFFEIYDCEVTVVVKGLKK